MLQKIEELCYAELDHLDNNTEDAEPAKPAPYTPTVYADVVGTMGSPLNESSAPGNTNENLYANMP